jgi:hypothetical protein
MLHDHAEGVAAPENQGARQAVPRRTSVGPAGIGSLGCRDSIERLIPQDEKARRYVVGDADEPAQGRRVPS